MEWVRETTTGGRKEGEGVVWNQGVLRLVGAGPKQPKGKDNGYIEPEGAKAHAEHARQRMRITCGCRNGLIAGGPQGEAPMLRAAASEKSCAAAIIAGGCRGCTKKGVWPGPRETTRHALLECAAKSTRDLTNWREAVAKKLRYILEFTKRIGVDARTIHAHIERATRAMERGNRDEGDFRALRQTVGGCVPWWDGNGEERDIKYNGALNELITHLQHLFIERTNEWTAYVETESGKRQTRWQHRGWLGMLLRTLRHYAKSKKRDRRAHKRALRHIGAELVSRYRAHKRDLQEERRVRECRRERVRRRLRRTIWGLVHEQREMVLIMQVEYSNAQEEKREREVGAIEKWVDRVHHAEGGVDSMLASRIMHAVMCLAAYVVRVSKVDEQEKRERRREAARERNRRRMRWTSLMRYYREQKQREILQSRLDHRGDRVCASTRNVGRLRPKGGVTYDETKRHETRIKEMEYYRVIRWPRRDKCVGPRWSTYCTTYGMSHNPNAGDRR